MRYIGAFISGLLSLLVLSVGWLYFSDAPLLNRYITIFYPGVAPEDSAYASLSPREQVIGDNSYQLPVASGHDKTISPESLVEMVDYAYRQN